ncbi:hypothetical protein AMECASPLE_032622 [Ameca splendens]|uniref:Uncharacterized protein n=1 Tax=Ameca splendens TaxID=208324 RepID=A0ABV0YHN6_9TELE
MLWKGLSGGSGHWSTMVCAIGRRRSREDRCSSSADRLGEPADPASSLGTYEQLADFHVPGSEPLPGGSPSSPICAGSSSCSSGPVLLILKLR